MSSRTLQTVLSVVTLLYLAPATVQGGVLYGSGRFGEIFTINQTTGVGTLVCTLPSAATTEIELDPGSGTAFFQHPDGTFTGAIFNIDTCAEQPAVPNGHSFTGLEYIGGVLYGAEIDSGGGSAPSELRTLDPSTGSSTLIGATGVGPLSGLAYDSGTGTLYGIGGGPGPANLYTVSLGTGVATLVGSTGMQAGSLEFGDGNRLFAGGTGPNTGELWEVNPATGAGTLIGPTGFAVGVTGLAFRPTAIGHLKCYKTKDTRAKAQYTLDLLANVVGFPDELGCSLKLGAKKICVEVDKQNVIPSPPGGGPTPPPNAGSVFLSYKIKCPKQTVPPAALVDQFGAGSFTVGTAKELLVPAQPGPANDHFKCYKAKDSRPKASYTVDLLAGVAGFVNELGCTVKLGSKMICVQVAKQNVAPSPPGGGPGSGAALGEKLVSYKLKCPKMPVPSIGTTDQFGAGTFTPGTAKSLLVPASPSGAFLDAEQD
jgi:hypothetical protein